MRFCTWGAKQVHCLATGVVGWLLSLNGPEARLRAAGCRLHAGLWLASCRHPVPSERLLQAGRQWEPGEAEQLAPCCLLASQGPTAVLRQGKGKRVVPPGPPAPAPLLTHSLEACPLQPALAPTHSLTHSPTQLPDVIRSQPALEQEGHGGGALQHEAVQRGGRQAQQLHALLQDGLHIGEGGELRSSLAGELCTFHC